MSTALRRTLITVFVVIVVLVALDRVGWAVTNFALEGQLKSQLKLASKPKVRVHGIPFLTQVVGGKYHDIGVDADDLTINSGTVEVRDLDADVHLRGSHVPFGKLVTWNVDTVPIDHVRATVVVPFRELVRLSRVPGLSMRASGGRLALSAPISGVGTVTATATPQVVGNVVRIVPGSASVNGQPLPAGLVGRISTSLSLAGLPFHLKLTGLAVTSTGLQGTATADDIVVRKGELLPGTSSG